MVTVQFNQLNENNVRKPVIKSHMYFFHLQDNYPQGTVFNQLRYFKKDWQRFLEQNLTAKQLDMALCGIRDFFRARFEPDIRRECRAALQENQSVLEEKIRITLKDCDTAYIIKHFQLANDVQLRFSDDLIAEMQRALGNTAKTLHFKKIIETIQIMDRLGIRPDDDFFNKWSARASNLIPELYADKLTDILEVPANLGMRLPRRFLHRWGERAQEVIDDFNGPMLARCLRAMVLIDVISANSNLRDTAKVFLNRAIQLHFPLMQTQAALPQLNNAKKHFALLNSLPPLRASDLRHNDLGL